MLPAKLRTPAALAVLAGLVAALVFAPAVDGAWIYDDWHLIANNRYVHSFDEWQRWFVTDFWNVNEEIVRFGSRISYWRPLVSASYAIDWQIAGDTPPWFHVMNLVWHAIVAGLAFAVLRRWLGGATLPALFAAVVFAVHPTKAESVAWIAGRTDVLCMIAVLLVCQATAWRLAGRRGGIALEALATLAAYGLKETAIVLPVFAAIEVWVAKGRPPLDLRLVGRMILGALPQLAVAITYLALRGAYLPIHAVGVENKLPPFDHLLIVLESFGRYLVLTFAPYELSIQQGLVRVADGKPVIVMSYAVIGAIGVAGLGALAIYARKRWPTVTLGIAFYFATLSPTANIIYSDMQTKISERFLYLPMFGAALVAGWAFERCTKRWCKAAALAIVVVFGVQSINRSLDFRDETTLWTREREIHPNSREARQFFMTKAITEKRYAAAMLEVLEITRHTLNEPAIVSTQLVEILVGLIPDRDREGLLKIDAFAKDLIEAKPPAATIQIRELQYTVQTQTRKFRDKMPKLRVLLVALRADVASRLGDDERAMALAKEAVAECARCLKIAVIAAMVFARAGRYDEAEAYVKSLEGYTLERHIVSLRKLLATAREARDRTLHVTGPAQLQARASELSALDAWGRAYEILAPYKDEIKGAPKFVVGFAELAVRAGEPAVAREVLATQMAPAEIDQRIAEWQEKMGWR